MPRPKDNEPCAVCIETVQTCNARDLSDNPDETRTHLQFMWDLRRLKFNGDEQAFGVALEHYALNRYLAPYRDNKRKAAGEKASRTVRSRNEISARALDNRCGFEGPRGLKCIRSPHPDEPGRHKF